MQSKEIIRKVMRRIKHRAILFFVVGVCLCVFCTRPVCAAEPDDPSTMYDGFLVTCPKYNSPCRATSLLRETVEHVINNVYWTPSEDHAQWLLETGQADRVELNYLLTLFDEEAPERPSDWPRRALCADEASALGLDGAGVRIAVIDSGVDRDNTDLQNANICEGFDYIGKTASMADDIYHGTKVAQLICGDANDLGVTGIARGSELVPLRCFSKWKGGSISMVVQAISDAVSVYHCDIINMSWGIAKDSDVLHDALRSAAASGVILVAAAGNVGAKYPQYSDVYPAAYDEVISVGSVDQNLTISENSIRNNHVTVCAPGEKIGFVSARGTSDIDSGTSFAAPCVSAGLALMMQYSPALFENNWRELLCELAVDLGEAGYDGAYGYGLFRLDRLLRVCVAHMERREDGSHILAAAMLCPQDGFLTAACYDARGRYLGGWSIPLEGHYAALDCAPPPDAVRCAVFFPNDRCIPQSEAICFNIVSDSAGSAVLCERASE